MKNRTIHYIRAIVAAGSLSTSMLIGVPLADEYLEHRAVESAVREMRLDLTNLELLRDSADGERNRAAQALAALNGRATTAATVTRTRDELVEMARQSGCQIRLIDAADVVTRDWLGNEDNPLVDVADRGDAWSPLELHTTPVGLTVVGTLGAIHELSRRISERRFLAVTDYVAIQPVEATGDSVQMEVRIRLFGLVDGSREEPSDPALDALPLVP